MAGAFLVKRGRMDSVSSFLVCWRWDDGDGWDSAKLEIGFWTRIEVEVLAKSGFDGRMRLGCGNGLCSDGREEERWV